MKRWVLLLLALSLVGNVVFLSHWLRNRPDTSPVFHPFEVNFDVTLQSLLDHGYERITGVDVVLLGKRKGDTLITYAIEYDCDSYDPEKDSTSQESNCKNPEVIWRNYIYTMAKLDSLALVELIEKNDGLILSDWIDIGSSSYWKEFWVKHRYSSIMFRCMIEKNENNEYIFSAQCDFPLTNRKKMLERKTRVKNAP